MKEFQEKCNKLPDLFNRYDIAQSALELSDDTDHTGDRKLFEKKVLSI